MRRLKVVARKQPRNPMATENRLASGSVGQQTHGQPNRCKFWALLGLLEVSWGLLGKRKEWFQICSKLCHHLCLNNPLIFRLTLSILVFANIGVVTHSRCEKVGYREPVFAKIKEKTWAGARRDSCQYKSPDVRFFDCMTRACIGAALRRGKRRRDMAGRGKRATGMITTYDKCHSGGLLVLAFQAEKKKEGR